MSVAVRRMRTGTGGQAADRDEKDLESGIPKDALKSLVKSGFAKNARGLLRRVFGVRLARVVEKLIVAMIVVVLLGVITISLFMQFRRFRLENPCDIVDRSIAELTMTARNGDSNTLPKIVHQQWKSESIPDGIFTEYHKRWKELFPEPEYTHMLWTDESARQLIKNEFPFFLETYDGYEFNIQRADATRYFVLYRYGGLYADLDYEPIINFWKFLPKDRVGVVESPYKFNEEVQNSLMVSPKADSFWNITFQVMLERKDSRHILFSTGPSMLDEAIRRSANTKNSVYILPCQSYQRIPLGEAGKYSDGLSIASRTVMAYLPTTKFCGDWWRKDDCQFALHHNTATYLKDKKNLWDLIFT